jgi:hypothetical protein
MANKQYKPVKKVAIAKPIIIEEDEAYDNIVIEPAKDYRGALLDIKDMIKKGVHVEKIIKFIESVVQ